MNLTPRQQRFVGEYLCDLNATQAAIRAKYSQKTAEVQGCRLLRNAQVAAAVEKGRAAMAIAANAEATKSTAGLNVARQALMDVAKLNGLVVERHETVTRSPEERAARLAELRAERERLARTH